MIVSFLSSYHTSAKLQVAQKRGDLGKIMVLVLLNVHELLYCQDTQPIQLGPTTQMAGGFRFTESVRWHDGKVWWVDMHPGKIYSMSPTDALPTLVATVEGHLTGGIGWVSRFISSCRSLCLSLVWNATH